MADKLKEYVTSVAINAWKAAKKKKDEGSKDKPTFENEKTENVIKPQNKEPAPPALTPSEEITKRYEDKLLSASSTQAGALDKIDGFLGTLTQKYDAYLDKLTGQSYKDTDYYNSIVSEYEKLGREMAYGAAASSAANNAGNFDTFGAANAHRQMLSYKNAGEQAARDAYAEEIERLAKGLGSYATDLSDAHKLLSDSAEKTDDYNISLIDALADYMKLKQSDKNSLYEDLSGELDKNNKTNRYLSYASMLAQIYPDYADEIQKVFFAR